MSAHPAPWGTDLEELARSRGLRRSAGASRWAARGAGAGRRAASGGVTGLRRLTGRALRRGDPRQLAGQPADRTALARTAGRQEVQRDRRRPRLVAAAQRLAGQRLVVLGEVAVDELGQPGQPGLVGRLLLAGPGQRPG